MVNDKDKDKEKDSYIRIRVDKQTKDLFMKMCKQKDINSSALLRRMIDNWIDDNRPFYNDSFNNHF